MLDGIALADSEGLITIGYQPWTDYVVETVATNLADSVGSRDASVVFRYNGPNDFYWAGLGLWNSFAGIAKKVGGVYTPLATSVETDQTIVQGQKYKLVVTVAGSAITLNVYDMSGALLSTVSANDPSFTSGGIGFRQYASHAQYDYVVASAPSILWLPIVIGTGLGIGALVYLTR